MPYVWLAVRSEEDSRNFCSFRQSRLVYVCGHELTRRASENAWRSFAWGVYRPGVYIHFGQAHFHCTRKSRRVLQVLLFRNEALEPVTGRCKLQSCKRFYGYSVTAVAATVAAMATITVMATVAATATFTTMVMVTVTSGS